MSRGIASYDKLIERLYREVWKDESLTFREILRIMYLDKKMSIRDISRELDVSISFVHKWLNDYGLIEKKLKWK